MGKWQDKKKLSGFVLLCALSVAGTVAVHAQVFTSEFSSDPVSEWWELAAEYCDPNTWNDDGLYYQKLDLDACPPGPGGGADVYRRSLQPANGDTYFFTEFRVRTNGDRSEIPGGAPALLAMGNFGGVLYHITISRDLVKFLRDVDLPIWFIEIEPEAAHTYRVELYPNGYAFYIDGFVIDEGLSEGELLAFDPSISWRGRAWYLPCENAWDYIRYGVIPADGRGDFDSDEAVTLTDLYFAQECLTNERIGINGGPDMDAGPGCRFADFDADSDVDLLDFAEFQNLFAQP